MFFPSFLFALACTRPLTLFFQVLRELLVKCLHFIPFVCYQFIRYTVLIIYLDILTQLLINWSQLSLVMSPINFLKQYSVSSSHLEMNEAALLCFPGPLHLGATHTFLYSASDTWPSSNQMNETILHFCETRLLDPNFEITASRGGTLPPACRVI